MITGISYFRMFVYSSFLLVRYLDGIDPLLGYILKFRSVLSSISLMNFRNNAAARLSAVEPLNNERKE